MAAIAPIEISRAGTGTLKDAVIGIASLLVGDDYVEYAPAVSSDITGITFANERANSVDVEIGGTTYPPGTALMFDILAASNATISTGKVFARYVTVNGEELAVEYPLKVVERLANS